MADPAPLITGTDFICVPTRDYERRRQFYGEVLGLPFSKRWGDMPAGEFETGNLTIAVMQPDAFGIEFEPHSLPIELHVEDFEAAKCRARVARDRVRGRDDRLGRLLAGVLQGPRRQLARRSITGTRPLNANFEFV